MAHVLLLACPRCGDEWLTFDIVIACPYCGSVPWTLSATWTERTLPWGEALSGRILEVLSAADFLWWLDRHCVAEHPYGPIGSHVVTPGMQLVPATAPNGDTTWSWCPTAGSEN